MARIKVRDNGPLLVEGEDVTLCDASGEEIDAGRRPFALCRCGASATKPFCDGAHGRVGFQASGKASG